MKRLRILCIDTENVWRGGQEQLFTLMRGLVERGHGIELAAPRQSPLSLKSHETGIACHDFRQRQELSPAACLRLRSLLGRRFDVVHSNSPRTLWAASLAAGIGTRSRPLRIAARRVIFPLRSGLSRWKYNYAVDATLAVCASIRRVLTAAGVREERVHVVYEGVDLEALDGMSAPADQARDGNSVRIGIVAHLSSEKGHRDLLQAASNLAPSHPQLRLVIVGDGALRADLEAHAASLGLGDQVIFTGFRRDSEAIMKSLDIFCLPSHSEGFSSALLAAMGNRLPVVASRVGGNAEMVEEGETGFLTPPKDPSQLAIRLGQLLESSRLRRQLGQAGRTRVEQRFTLRSKIESTERLYFELLDSHSSGNRTNSRT